MWVAEKSDVDEGCQVLNAYLVAVLWFAINPVGNPSILIADALVRNVLA
jgi:hypothetical protein